MKILYLGSVIFSRLILDELLSKKIEITNIVSLKFSKKLFKSDYYDLSKTSIKYNIKNLKVTNINSKSSIRWVKKYQPDLILCIGWSQLISKEILNIPIMGTIGFHPSKLPKNRGRHPIIWSLALGLKETASTYYLMDEKIDNGNILSQKTIKITRNDNATKLYYKIAKVAKKQILELVLNIYKNKKIKIINNKKSIGNYWRSRSFIDGQINWNSTPENTENLLSNYSFFYYLNDQSDENLSSIKPTKNNNDSNHPSSNMCKCNECNGLFPQFSCVSVYSENTFLNQPTNTNSNICVTCLEKNIQKNTK